MLALQRAVFSYWKQGLLIQAGKSHHFFFIVLFLVAHVKYKLEFIPWVFFFVYDYD